MTDPAPPGSRARAEERAGLEVLEAAGGSRALALPVALAVPAIDTALGADPGLFPRPARTAAARR